MLTRPDDRQLPMKELTLLVRDLRQPRPLVYWLDLIGSVVAVHVGLLLSGPLLQGHLIIAIAGFALAVLALYRASYFNHEIAHQSRRLPGFELVWNLLVGIPLQIPSFLYSDHRNHHSVQSFATEYDAEYFAPRFRGIRGAAALLACSFLLPFAYAARFALIAPAAWLVPSIRTWADTRVSSIGLIGLSSRAPPGDSERWQWRVQEVACFCYLAVSLAGLITGILPFELVLRFYAVVVCVLALHGVRIMAGHRYEADANARSLMDQLLDSFNFPQNFLTRMIMPVGFHLHALHHIFPSLPYHNMEEAHRRILAALPADSPYHSVSSPSFFRAAAAFLTRRPEPI